VLNPPGEARLDWQILCDILTRMGHPHHYDGPEAVFREFTDLTKNYRGLRYEHLEGRGKLWPCPDPERTEGKAVLFGDGFPTRSGRGTFAPADVIPPHELPNADYPFVLNTGRTLAYWHTGTMTRRSKALDAIEPNPWCEMHPDDLELLGLEDGDRLRLVNSRGAIVLPVRATTDVSRGGVFVPFHFREAAANLLTSDLLDPYGKIPGYKFSAVRIEKA